MMKKVLLLLALSTVGGSISAAGNDVPAFDFTQSTTDYSSPQLFSHHFNRDIEKAGSVQAWFKKQTYSKWLFENLIEAHEKALSKAKKSLIAPIILENALIGLPSVVSSLAGAALATHGDYKEGLVSFIVGAFMSYVFYDFCYTAGDAREDRQDYRDYKKSLDYLQQLKALVAQS